MKPGEYPAWLQQLIDSPPKAGEGVHTWLFRVARQLHAHLPSVEIIRLIESKAADCGRVVTQREIVAAVRDALPCAWQPNQDGQYRPAPAQAKWPAVNQEQRTAIIRDGARLADLWELSPFRIEDDKSHTEEVIDALFPGNVLLCCGKSNSEFDTRLREEWRGVLAQLALIVPSPMTDRTGLTQEGKESAHSLNNTGPRRFLIVEFDSGTTDEHAALLVHLAGYAPMVCAVHSGGKSLHGWFFVEGQDEEKVMKFFKYACSLGADPKLWTRSQFCRMPDGTRQNEDGTTARQTIFFLNLTPLLP